MLRKDRYQVVPDNNGTRCLRCKCTNNCSLARIAATWQTTRRRPLARRPAEIAQTLAT